MEIHVVSKIDNCQHATVSVGVSGSPSGVASSDEAAGAGGELAQENLAITARPILLSLTSNNLSYARSGEMLHWWDAYPVPLSTPPHPYCDNTAWGIVPAWGYAVVLSSSRHSTLSPGAILWGFWPTADMPVALKLQASHQSVGTWTEVSGHRQRMMTSYNVYTEKDGVAFSPPVPASLTLGERQLKDLAWETLFRPTWQSGYLLSQHVFSPSAAAAPAADAIPPVHPLGMGGAWSRQDADLSSAIVVSLSASGKTAQSFAYNILCRPAHTGPLGLLQVTSTPGLISTAVDSGVSSEYRTPTKVLSYTELGPEVLEWMQAQTRASRIVIVDFGARGNVLEELLGRITDHASLQTLGVTILQVGSQQKVYTSQEKQATQLAFSKLGKLQFNSSGVRDAAIRCIGEETFHDQLRSAWDDWLRRSHNLIPYLHIKDGEGISGPGGIEGGWERLSKGLVGAEEGLVYRIRLASEGGS